MGPADIGRATFPGALLGGMPDDEFFARYWRRRYLHVPGGANRLLSLMPSRVQVESFLDQPCYLDADVAHFVSLTVDSKPPMRQWTLGVGPPRDRYRDEAVNLMPADRWFPSLIPLALALQRSFDATPSLQLFWGPSGGGANPHRDSNDSFVIQIDGSKRWYGTDITDVRPAVSGDAGASFTTEPTAFDLEPGDVLYKPSHAVHATRSGSAPTLSLTCSIVTRTAADLVLDLLRERMASDPVWLERLPLARPGLGSDDDHARPRIEAALAELRGLTLDDLEHRSRS
jgi:ribosomal protein L16 Arg81 hydroxylase